MSLKVLGSAIAALLSVSASPSPRVNPPNLDEPANLNYNAIARIHCGATARGTAFWIGPNRLVSAQHVTVNGDCTINGVPLVKIREDIGLDLAELRGPTNPNHLEVDCRGMREGEVYFAVGWAQGLFRHTSRLLATKERTDNNLIVMLGEVFPGQSGGPNIGRNGKVAGITNMRSLALPFAFNRNLAGSWICQS